MTHLNFMFAILFLLSTLFSPIVFCSTISTVLYSSKLTSSIQFNSILLSKSNWFQSNPLSSTWTLQFLLNIKERKREADLYMIHDNYYQSTWEKRFLEIVHYYQNEDLSRKIVRNCIDLFMNILILNINIYNALYTLLFSSLFLSKYCHNVTLILYYKNTLSSSIFSSLILSKYCNNIALILNYKNTLSSLFYTKDNKLSFYKYFFQLSVHFMLNFLFLWRGVAHSQVTDTANWPPLSREHPVVKDDEEIANSHLNNEIAC